MKYFISCAVPNRKIGDIQMECDNLEEMKTKAEKMCPEKCFFKSYELEEFEEEMPINEFVTMSQMIELGY